MPPVHGDKLRLTLSLERAIPNSRRFGNAMRPQLLLLLLLPVLSSLISSFFRKFELHQRVLLVFFHEKHNAKSVSAPRVCLPLQPL